LTRFFEEINSPEYTDFFSPHPLDATYAEHICHYQGRDLYYAIVHNGTKIIGYGMLRGWDEGYEIPSIGLCVLKKYQGSGLGKILLHFLETVIRLNGCDKVMLKVKKNNLAAFKLYREANYSFKEYDEQSWVGFKQLFTKEDK
jgi:ribosomal protein S18 acetylase RimI-like enzyme